jgi:hypothetical protein
MLLIIIIKLCVLQRPTGKLIAVDRQQREERLDRRKIMTDVRKITVDRLWGKLSGNNNWSAQQPEDFYIVLIKLNII